MSGDAWKKGGIDSTGIYSTCSLLLWTWTVCCASECCTVHFFLHRLFLVWQCSVFFTLNFVLLGTVNITRFFQVKWSFLYRNGRFTSWKKNSNIGYAVQQSWPSKCIPTFALCNLDPVVCQVDLWQIVFGMCRCYDGCDVKGDICSFQLSRWIDRRREEFASVPKVLQTQQTSIVPRLSWLLFQLWNTFGWSSLRTEGLHGLDWKWRGNHHHLHYLPSTAL